MKRSGLALVPKFGLISVLFWEKSSSSKAAEKKRGMFPAMATEENFAAFAVIFFQRLARIATPTRRISIPDFSAPDGLLPFDLAAVR